MISRAAQEKLARVFDGPTLTLLGTVDADGRPWTRYVMGVLDDRGTIRIATTRDSRKIADVENLPFVHLLVGRDLFSSDCEYVQIAGRAVVVDGAQPVAAWNPAAQTFLSGANPSYALIEVRPHRVEFWTAKAAPNENPIVFEEENADFEAELSRF
ncbi:MAG: pyridoxamine 5'-phosphate oxidase family protein, partial [Thermoguttaceae bacterium]|nr:pyridoxamine 5'-phosphate oxidase family protein [Thermoguttaceae bacterium]